MRYAYDEAVGYARLPLRGYEEEEEGYEYASDHQGDKSGGSAHISEAVLVQLSVQPELP